MYKSELFEERDLDQLLEFMQAHPFITLIGFDGNYPIATQVPVQIVKDGDDIRLVGHVMKKTDHCLAYEKNENVLALFTGAHSYISASVYEKPAVASTWNYKSVHAKGKIRLLGNEETRIIIRDLTDHYENPATSAAAFHKMDDAYIEKNLKAISGFEIVITDLDAIFKLSQNHSEGNRKAIVSDLENRKDPGSHDVASEMKKNL